MTVRRAPRHRSLTLLGIALLTLAACNENISGGAACPSLCPGQQLEVHDTVITASDLFDTTALVNGIPPLGTETNLLVARRADALGDSVVSGAIIRFDSLLRNFPRTDTTKPAVPLVSVSAASYVFTSIPDTSLNTDSVRFEVVDVDANVPDLDTATIRNLLITRPPIGTLTVAKDTVGTQHTVPLDTAFVRQRVTTPGARIRLGVRMFPLHVTGHGGAQFGIVPRTSTSASTGVQTGTTLQYMGHAAATDTTDSLNFVNYASSKSSGGPEFKYLANYQLVIKGSPPAPSGVQPVGGLPSSRLYLRFNLPSALIDSSTTIVRATLIFHQMADPTYAASDSLQLIPRVVIASPIVTDLSKAALLLAEPTTIPLLAQKANTNQARADTIVLVSRAASIVTLWRTEGPVIMQRAIVLQSSGEGRDPRRFLLYTTAAADSLRPQLHLTYIPRSGFGLP
ncbi:MAG TPA: hypothetical protein VN717_07860 [Gemmatimonadaceae bacterium]|nr:hypothetical protein [Gemmatimonadaceae bacterium]